MTKSTKSHLRGLSSLLKNTLRVHESVARAMRGKCVRHGAKRKSVVLPLHTISAIPRVRTKRTREPSRFVHALSARPLDNGWRGRGFGKSADGIEYIFFILAVGYTWALACVAQFIDTRDHSPADIFFTTRRIISVDFFAAECAYSS